MSDGYNFSHIVTENVWYHVSLVVTTKSVSIYVNGKYESDSTRLISHACRAGVEEFDAPLEQTYQGRTSCDTGSLVVSVSESFESGTGNSLRLGSDSADLDPNSLTGNPKACLARNIHDHDVIYSHRRH